MIELTSGIFNAAKSIYTNNKVNFKNRSLHNWTFAIAITVLMLIADVSMVALTDAIIEPANAVWYFLLDKF